MIAWWVNIPRILLPANFRFLSLRLNVQHGKGKFVYRSGNVYEGEWSNDVPHGRGIFMEGNVIYDIEHDNGTVPSFSCASVRVSCRGSRNVFFLAHYFPWMCMLETSTED